MSEDKKITELQQENEVLHDKLRRISDWCDAYPVDIFPEPNLKRAAVILEDGIRHVLKGVRRIIEEQP